MGNKDCFFQLTTMLLGINVTDAWKLADYHKILNYSKKEDRKMPISRLAGILDGSLSKMQCFSHVHVS